jgi:hypothetical protein
MRYASLAVAVAFLVGGCSILEDEVNRGFAQREPLTSVTFTTADVRVITQRSNRPGWPTPIVCTEPSPDVAKALSAAAAASGSVANKGSFSAGGASAEAVAALAGRSTALLGLRDGVYRACEAYANGVIGADAYALVLSRYGQLMTTLFLAQDVTGAAGTEAGATVQSPPINVNMPGAASLSVGQGAAAPPDPPAPSGSKPTPDPASAAPKAASANTPPTTPQAGSAGGTPALGPLALTRMNEDYLNLAYNPDAIIIACVNHYDQSHIYVQNSWLEKLCDKFSSLGVFAALAKAAEDLVAKHVLASPIDPAAAIVQPAQSKPTAQKKPTVQDKPAAQNKPIARNKVPAQGQPRPGAGQPLPAPGPQPTAPGQPSPAAGQPPAAGQK